MPAWRDHMVPLPWRCWPLLLLALALFVSWPRGPKSDGQWRNTPHAGCWPPATWCKSTNGARGALAGP